MNATMIGTVVTAEYLDDVDVPAGVTPVWGEDWAGKSVMRPVRSGVVTALRGWHGQGFDTRGPSASKCKQCEVLLVGEGSLTNVIQRHYFDTHGQSLALLP